MRLRAPCREQLHGRSAQSCVRGRSAAFWLKRAGVAVMLAGEVEDRAFLRQPSRGGESAVVFPWLFAARADVRSCLRDRRRSRCAKEFRPCVRTCRSVSRAARSRARPPTSHPTISAAAVAPIGDQARRGDIELFGRAIDHCLGRADFGLANGCRRLDVHDHRVLQIDEIVVGVGVERQECCPPPYSGPPDLSARSTSARPASRRRSCGHPEPKDIPRPPNWTSDRGCRPRRRHVGDRRRLR